MPTPETRKPMSDAVADYRQITCGCCTGRPVTIEATWGKYEMRTDQCTCWMHQDTGHGSPARKCTRHQPVTAARGME